MFKVHGLGHRHAPHRVRAPRQRLHRRLRLGFRVEGLDVSIQGLRFKFEGFGGLVLGFRV